MEHRKSDQPRKLHINHVVMMQRFFDLPMNRLLSPIFSPDRYFTEIDRTAGLLDGRSWHASLYRFVHNHDISQLGEFGDGDIARFASLQVGDGGDKGGEVR